MLRNVITQVQIAFNNHAFLLIIITLSCISSLAYYLHMQSLIACGYMWMKNENLRQRGEYVTQSRIFNLGDCNIISRNREIILIVFFLAGGGSG